MIYEIKKGNASQRSVPFFVSPEGKLLRGGAASEAD